jgi:hypothetical protein
VAGRTATGPRAGRRVQRLGDRIDADDLPLVEGERCTTTGGVSLHANVAVPARDRLRLERLCRYAARPPVATERLFRLDDGRLLYRLKRRWRDGTTHVVFEPIELVEKLAALVPAPRFHLVRYHGILGPCASERDRVLPGRSEPSAGSLDLRDATAAESPTDSGGAAPRPATPSRPAAHGPEAPCEDSGRGEGPMPRRRRRLSWAELMRRVFAIDVLECPRCGGRMRILAAIHPPETTRAILECLALPSRAPPLAPARPDEADDAGDFGA